MKTNGLGLLLVDALETGSGSSGRFCGILSVLLLTVEPSPATISLMCRVCPRAGGVPRADPMAQQMYAQPQIPQTYDPMAQAHAWGQPAAYGQAPGYLSQPPPPMGQPPPPTMNQAALHHAAPPLLQPQQWSGHPHAQWPQVRRVMPPVAQVRRGRGPFPLV